MDENKKRGMKTNNTMDENENQYKIHKNNDTQNNEYNCKCGSY